MICFDFTRDGRLDLAVTIASGGTAGDIGLVVFRATPGGFDHIRFHWNGVRFAAARSWHTRSYRS